MRQVIELHDKYMLYVGGCFANSSLFHKALKEAFEFFCNKNVAGSSTAELMANFCDNLLRKVCNAACSLFSCLHLNYHSPLCSKSFSCKGLTPVVGLIAWPLLQMHPGLSSGKGTDLHLHLA